jgi:hypothetical protein
VAWTAGANATGYEIDYENGAGGWNVLVANTPSSPYTDSLGAAAHLNTVVSYRVVSLRTGTVWTSTSTTATADCGIGPVTDLAATNSCINDVITWTTPFNNTGTYKVEYSANAGAWTSLGNIAASTSGSLSYINSASLTPTLTKGTTYSYRITPNSGAGSVSNTTATLTWDGFYVSSVALASASPGTLASGDTATVDFSKTVSETGASINDNDITVSPKKTLYLADATTTVNNGFGSVLEGGNVFTNTGNVSAVLSGTHVWNSFGGWAGAQWVWTSTGATSAGGALSDSATLSGVTWTPGAGSAQCDPTPATLPASTLAKVNLTAPVTGATATYTGRW